MDCSPSGSSAHGVFLARILEWVAISFSGRSSWPTDWTQVSSTVGRFFTIWVTRAVHFIRQRYYLPSLCLSINFGHLTHSPYRMSLKRSLNCCSIFVTLALNTLFWRPTMPLLCFFICLPLIPSSTSSFDATLGNPRLSQIHHALLVFPQQSVQTLL